jgi:predicted ATP-binding protein involved in virulence
MAYFLTNIHVNKVFHLENFDIKLDTQQLKHLLITGKNGSGKTVLVNAMVDFFDKIKSDKTLNFLQYKKHLGWHQQQLSNQKTKEEILRLEKDIKYYEAKIEAVYGKVALSFNDLAGIAKALQEGNFLFAFYEANRKTQMSEPKNPTKPDLTAVRFIKEKKVAQFLNFIVDLKIQEALARNEKLDADAEKIQDWFTGFEQLLKEIFENPNIRLEFNYKDYRFFIVDKEKRFTFTELSDGYSAIIDIVTDLILKMQETGRPNGAYLKQGIVIIDEIETHLHLELQRLILPFLTKVFPNIQFIVTTHSPFILNSLKEAIAYDLEKREKLEDLTEYSFEALAENYFGVKSESSYLQVKWERFKELFCKKEGDLTGSEKNELAALDEELEAIREILAPQLKGAYYQLKSTKSIL